MKRLSCFLLFYCIHLFVIAQTTAYIRINQLGYSGKGAKVAVLGSKDAQVFSSFVLIDANTNRPVYEGKAGNSFGKYGPFTNTYRLDFSTYNKKGKYFLKAGNITSPTFTIDDNVYDGAAD